MPAGVPARGGWSLQRAGLAPERAHELAGAGANVAETRANLLQSRAQLGVADLDRQHRVLERGERGVRTGGRLDGGLDEAARAVRRGSGRGGRELLLGQAVAARELGVGSPGPAVGRLHRREQLTLELIRLLLVQLLVGLAERAERGPISEIASASESSSCRRPSAVV